MLLAFNGAEPDRRVGSGGAAAVDANGRKIFRGCIPRKLVQPCNRWRFPVTIQRAVGCKGRLQPAATVQPVRRHRLFGCFRLQMEFATDIRLRSLGYSFPVARLRGFWEVREQFLELTRRWLILADSLTGFTAMPPPTTPTE